LRDYAALNYTAICKILKKWDKHHPSTASAAHTTATMTTTAAVAGGAEQKAGSVLAAAAAVHNEAIVKAEAAVAVPPSPTADAATAALAQREGPVPVPLRPVFMRAEVDGRAVFGTLDELNALLTRTRVRPRHTPKHQQGRTERKRM
jgi:hypothetical protein